MQINNITASSQSYGKKHQEPVSLKMDLHSFINASDEDLYAYAQYQNKQKHKGDTSRFIGACVGVDALSSAILKSHVEKNINGEVKVVKAPLSAKIGAGAKTLKGWGIGFAAIGVLMGIKKTVLDKSEKFKEFENNHPLGSLLAEVGVLALMIKGGKSVLGKTKISEKMTPLKNIIDKASKKIDNSKVSTFIMNRCSEAAQKVNEKAPTLGKTGRLLLSNSVLLMLMGGMMKISKNNKEVQQSYQSMKLAQEEIRENIY